ncbi:OsmC family protein [Smaragdicoccus niigatensis]|uniref:OsmC family protein n=1 Tax=Smaragdicoccus niigatensis TaxID=359359 RepID=UPI00036291AE|nr:OsmC family protein [Smaragdicoccus niigatensis]
MSDQTPDVPKPPTELWVERTGQRRYTGKSSRGAEVLVGSESVEGVFTPGELMKIALGACSAMSADIPLTRKLGENFDATVRISGKPDRDQEIYPELHEVFELDLSELDEATQKRVLTIAERAIDKVCTVGRTLKAGTKVTLEFKLD